MKRYLILTIAATACCAWFLSCDLEDAKDDSAGTAGSGSCFVTASVTEISSGDSVTLSAAKSVSWDEYSSISVAGQTLSNANPEVEVSPEASRVYSAVGKMTDGSTNSCDVKIIVDGAELNFGCTLVVDPPRVSSTQPVTVTLQVTGTEEVSKTSINNVDLESAAGGSKEFTVINDTSFVGNVVSADGEEANCSVDVDFETKVADGECTKVEPSPEDYAKLKELQAGYDDSNGAALLTKQAELIPDDANEVTYQSADNAGYFNETSICKTISQQDDASLCTIEIGSGSSPQFALVTYDGKHYEIYGGQFNTTDITVIEDTDGKPKPVFIARNNVQDSELEVEVCECTFNTGADSLVAGDIAPPALDFVWYEVNADIRDDQYTGEAVSFYEYKVVNIKQIKVAPPPGTPKPECPIDWNVAT